MLKSFIFNKLTFLQKNDFINRVVLKNLENIKYIILYSEASK